MNTAIFSPTGASAGIGFAIPVSTVKNLVPQLKKYSDSVLASPEFLHGKDYADDTILWGWEGARK